MDQARILGLLCRRWEPRIPTARYLIRSRLRCVAYKAQIGFYRLSQRRAGPLRANPFLSATHVVTTRGHEATQRGLPLPQRCRQRALAMLVASRVGTVLCWTGGGQGCSQTVADGSLSSSHSGLASSPARVARHQRVVLLQPVVRLQPAVRQRSEVLLEWPICAALVQLSRPVDSSLTSQSSPLVRHGLREPTRLGAAPRF